MTGVDTNILIYACDTRDSHRQSMCLDLLSALRDGVLLWQVACEFIAPSRKLADQGFTAEQAWQRLSEYLRLFPLILPNTHVLAK